MANRDSAAEMSFIVSNQGRTEKVNKRQEENEPTHFYHVSPHKFKVGEVVRPGPGDTEVSLADSPAPHQTISRERVLPDEFTKGYLSEIGRFKKEWEGKWYSYEVEPLGGVRWEPEFQELRCKAAEVVRVVGDARALLQHNEERLKKHGVNPDKSFASSRVLDTRNIRKGGVKIEGRGKQYWEHSMTEYGRKKK
ncbi:hypothetical protein M1116_01865 [Patescibacteria group bacterium]|nr:hypothetical protein [Patescibacteria group bacterium]